MCGRCVNNHACTGRSTWYVASRLKKNKSFRPFLRSGASQKKALKRHNFGSCFLQFKGTNKKNRSCDRFFLCQAYACQVLCLLCNFCFVYDVNKLESSCKSLSLVSICIDTKVILCSLRITSFFCRNFIANNLCVC